MEQLWLILYKFLIQIVHINTVYIVTCSMQVTRVQFFAAKVGHYELIFCTK